MDTTYFKEIKENKFNFFITFYFKLNAIELSKFNTKSKLKFKSCYSNNENTTKLIPKTKTILILASKRIPAT